MKDTITVPLSVLESLCDKVEIDLDNTQDNLAMKEINNLKKERDELKRQLDNIKASTIHTCHANCNRPMCVLRRERDEAREELKKLEGAYEDATNYYARMIELREELDQVKEELKNKTYDQLKS